MLLCGELSIVSRGTISTRRLLEDIREGYNVELGRIGYFSAKLTGRLKGQSFKDLNAFVEQKRLTTYGRGSHLVYMREKPEE